MSPQQRSAFREFVRTHHPDVGGDPAEFAAGLAGFRAPPPPDERRYDGTVEFVSNRRRRLAAIARIVRRIDRIRPGRLPRRVR